MTKLYGKMFPYLYDNRIEYIDIMDTTNSIYVFCNIKCAI
jgi:hypothetical protein